MGDNTCICTGGLTNSFAPTWCCPLRTMKILDENKQEYEVAEEKDAPMMQNIFACNFMRLCLPGLDQYKMTFPPNATPEDKSLLLAGSSSSSSPCSRTTRTAKMMIF